MQQINIGLGQPFTTLIIFVKVKRNKTTKNQSLSLSLCVLLRFSFQCHIPRFLQPLIAFLHTHHHSKPAGTSGRRACTSHHSFCVYYGTPHFFYNFIHIIIIICDYDNQCFRHRISPQIQRLP